MQRIVDDVVAATPGVSWSIMIPGLASHAPDRRQRTASIGKLLLLAEVARRIEDGTLDENLLLHKDDSLAVADSGLWQHLRVASLPVADLALLVAAVSDNYATNVLLAHVGLRPIADLAARLRLRDTLLLDFVRDHRGPSHPPALSYGTARELAGLMELLARRELISAAVSDRVDGWLATGTDLSMVAAGFSLDPLAHIASPLRNKTGTDDGIRADVGHTGDIAYAVLATWDPPLPAAPVLDGMRAIGAALAGLTR
jgi:beta-lactamase class A